MCVKCQSINSCFTFCGSLLLLLHCRGFASVGVNCRNFWSSNTFSLTELNYSEFVLIATIFKDKRRRATSVRVFLPFLAWRFRSSKLWVCVWIGDSSKRTLNTIITEFHRAAFFLSRCHFLSNFYFIVIWLNRLWDWDERRRTRNKNVWSELIFHWGRCDLSSSSSM